jgi:hypothetical protein
MGLIEIPILERELFPLGLRQVPRLDQHALKSLNAMKQLRIQAHFCSEQINEPAITDLRLLS